MDKYTLTLLFFLSLFTLNTRAQSYIWAENITGSSYQMPNDMVVSESGASYTCGWSIGNSTFGDITVSGVSYDGWIVKYDINGDEQWAQRLGSNLYDAAFEVDVDAYDGVYVAGWFYPNIFCRRYISYGYNRFI